jgi:hypothetical protein
VIDLAYWHTCTEITGMATYLNSPVGAIAPCAWPRVHTSGGCRIDSDEGTVLEIVVLIELA